MTIDNQQLAGIIGGLYYGVYEGRDSIEHFIEWLENDCPEGVDEDDFDDDGEDY